jgi:hypothetical protein
MNATRLVTIGMLLAARGACSQNAATGVFQAGEELQYKVQWNFMRLGTIVLRTERDTSSQDSSLYRVTMNVESNPALVFISIHEHNESLVSRFDVHSMKYLGTHCSGGDSSEIQYTYDRASRRVSYAEKDLRGGTLRYSGTLENVPPFVEGASLLFYARHKSHSGKAYGVPTMVNNRLHKTRLDFSGAAEDLEIDAVPHPVRSLRYGGTAEWKGGTSAGLSGEFTGWVSDDDAAIPLRAEMSVLVGSITIELEKWKRDGWVPPCAVQSTTHL